MNEEAVSSQPSAVSEDALPPDTEPRRGPATQEQAAWHHARDLKHPNLDPERVRFLQNGRGQLTTLFKADAPGLSRHARRKAAAQQRGRK